MHWLSFQPLFHMYPILHLNELSLSLRSLLRPHIEVRSAAFNERPPTAFSITKQGHQGRYNIYLLIATVIVLHKYL